MAITYLRQDQATIHAIIPINPPLPQIKSWSALEGGDIESEDTKTRPGGMVGQVNLGGPTTRTDATIMRPYKRELHPHLHDLEKAAGNLAMSIAWTPLDANGMTAGMPTHTITGILKNVNRPNWDSNATGVAMLSIVMGCDVPGTISH